jgi:hypothetical protein
MNANHFKPRKHLNADALIKGLRSQFEHLPDAIPHTSETSLADALMSGFAMFALKDPSLLAFQQRRNDENMKRIYHIKHVPCDTHMRTQLDEVDPMSLGPAFRDLFTQVQRGKELERYRFLDGSYLLLLDGVEYFRSTKIHCPRCLEQHHRNGTVSYYHQVVGAVIAHPDLPEVIPLMPEPIQRQDGAVKGDCERNASKRLLDRISREHPHLRFIVTEDALSANGPHIRLILSLGWHYILVAKPKDHTELFARMEAAVEAGTIDTYQFVDPQTGVLHCFRWLNQVPLNASHPDLLVNFLEYWQIGPDLQVQYYNSWVTDFECSRESVEAIMRGGRARWKVENETFNTLKNQGYHFEHNFGHGMKNLSVVFAMLMMLAFAVDQIQQLSNSLFRAAWAKCGTKRAFWEEIRTAFRAFHLTSMWELYEVVYRGYVKARPVILNSS